MTDGMDEMTRMAAEWDAPPPPAVPGDEAIDPAEVWEALRAVIDPEIGLDIVTLGLVYDVEAIENAVRVTFTLTTPHCPMEGIITEGVVRATETVRGVEHVIPHLVWEPRWNPSMIQEEGW